MSLLIFALCCAGCYYLIARAELTRWFWQPLDSVRGGGALLRCPACSGTWIGAALGHVVPLEPHAHGALPCLFATIEHALAGMVLTAITWALMKLALDVGTVHPEQPTPADQGGPDGEASREAHPEE